jgi:hypothetical protein
VRSIILRQLGIVETNAYKPASQHRAGESRAQECGASAEKGGVGILTIVAAALVAEVVMALLAGSYLHHRSELSDAAESNASPKFH